MKNNKIFNVIALTRPKHIVKNFLIFAPLLFGVNVISQEQILSILSGFIVFCLVASSIYIINDYKDVEKDRLHPVKKSRPLASGAVSKFEAVILLVVLLATAVLLSISIRLPILAVGLVGVYFIMNLAYSFGLKNIPIIDIIILSSGFIIRLFFGSSISGIHISSMLYLVVMSGAFYLGTSKRYNEIIKIGHSARSVLKKYTAEYLKSLSNIFTVLIIVFYTQWCLQAKEPVRDFFLASIPGLIIILMIYIYSSEKDSSGDPTDLILKNKYLLATGLIFFVYIMFIIRL